MHEKHATVSQLMDWFNLESYTLYRYAKAFREERFFSDGVKGGRPPLVDKENLVILKQKTNNASRSKQALLLGVFNRELADSVRRTHGSRGGNSFDGSFSASTKLRTMKKVKLATTAYAQTTAAPRLREEADVRNHLVESAVLEAFQRPCSPVCVVNMDATQYACGKGNIKIEVVYDPEETRLLGEPLTRAIQDADKLGLSIKVYNQICAAGYYAPQVFLVADASMEEAAISTIWVPGLSPSATPGEGSWLVRTKTRCGNVAFYKWFGQFSMVPFVAKLRGMVGGDETKAFYLTDGEYTQLAGLMDEEVRPLILAQKAALVKGCCSMSATSNSLDAGNIHKGTKKVALHMPDAEVFFGMEAVQKQMDELLAVHWSHLPKERRDLIVDRLLRVNAANSKVLSKKIIQHSFQKSGQVAPDFGPIDFLNAKMALLPKGMAVSTATCEAVRAAFPRVVECVLARGKVTEKELDQLGVPATESDDRRTAAKDARPVTNQRCLVLNHADVEKEWDRQLAAPAARAESALARQEAAKSKKDAADKDKIDRAVAKAAQRAAAVIKKAAVQEAVAARKAEKAQQKVAHEMAKLLKDAQRALAKAIPNARGGCGGVGGGGIGVGAKKRQALLAIAAPPAAPIDAQPHPAVLKAKGAKRQRAADARGRSYSSPMAPAKVGADVAVVAQNNASPLPAGRGGRTKGHKPARYV